jgi:hypothetical protein
MNSLVVLEILWVLLCFRVNSVPTHRNININHRRSLTNESMTLPASRDHSFDSTSIFIMGTTGHGPSAWYNWYTRIVPSFRTWASAYTNVFVVMPNNEAMYLFLQEHQCVNKTNNIEFHCPEWGAHEGPTILVTETWDCNDNYHGDGPCCKANFAFWSVV